MKHDVRFVTCIYDDLHDTKFRGRLNRGVHYGFSLSQLAMMNVPFYCFTDKINFYKFAPLMALHDIKNVRFYQYDLNKYPLTEKIEAVRNSNPGLYRNSPSWNLRCVEIMWAKFNWINYVCENLLEKETMIYWIDVGLSHDGVIPKRYNSVYKTKKYNNEAHEYHHRFYNDLLFDEQFPELLAEYTGKDKVLNFVSTHPQHSDEFTLKLEKKHFIGTAIGGLFGGNSELMNHIAKEGMAVCNQLLETECLVKEEDILTYILNKKHLENGNLDDHKIYLFDTWYHEDWNVYRSEQVSFSDFFKELGK